MKTLAEQLKEIETLTKLLGSLNSAKFVAEKQSYSSLTEVKAKFDYICWDDGEVVKEFIAELNEAIKPLIEKRKNMLKAALSGLAIKEL